MTVDLVDTKILIADAMRLIDEIDGLDLDNRNPGKDPAKAKASRHLQRIANLLQRAANETENQYFVSRGYPDPLA